MIHTCNVHCHALDPTEKDLLGIDDSGKWLPFAFLLDTVFAIKQSTDEEGEMLFNCTTVFTDAGDTYTIDTPFFTFQELWMEYMRGGANTEDSITL